MNKKTISLNKGHNRKANLRQHLLRASRVVNTSIVENLHQHGYTKLKSTHTALLSNLDLDGNNLTIIAKRAGMTKQAMGRLANELIILKYIKSTTSLDDKRAVKIAFTPAGLKLMNHSFSIMKQIENRCISRLGNKHFNNLLNSLDGIVDELNDSPE